MGCTRVIHQQIPNFETWNNYIYFEFKPLSIK